MSKTGSEIYIERANLRRGDLLNRCISLEREIDKYIANYFIDKTDNKNLELLFLILSTERMTFEGKRQIADWIAKNKDKELIKIYPKMFKEIQELINFRNLIAHSVLDYIGFHKKNEKEITTLTTYRNQVKLIDLTEEECKKWGDIASQYTAVLMYWTTSYVAIPSNANDMRTTL